MKKIGLISDTHNYLDPKILNHLDSCDEIWHAGDFGTHQVSDQLESFANFHQAILRGVFGNIDGPDIRNKFPEQLIFSCEGINVLIRHIGGHPGKYAPGVKDT
ncbi:MAG TPA: metallophosphoesterase family protein, partial [Puia sp.]|nr:metallophosphoesterase family protein [Puia sp.]